MLMRAAVGEGVTDGEDVIVGAGVDVKVGAIVEVGMEARSRVSVGDGVGSQFSITTGESELVEPRSNTWQLVIIEETKIRKMVKNNIL